MTTEFNKVFDQMEAPEYPATCDNCGYEATNAEVDQHICSDTPAAPERGEWSYHEGEDYIVVLGDDHDTTENPIASVYEVEYAKQIITEHNQYSSLVEQQRFLEDRIAAQTETMAKVVHERNELRNQHSTLVAQRERLIEGLRLATKIKTYGEPDNLEARNAAMKVLTAIEQEGTR